MAKKKYAITITETLQRTIIVEVEGNECDACDLAERAYKKCAIELHADNSAVETSYVDETKIYKEIFSNEEISKMEYLVETEQDKYSWKLDGEEV